MDDDPRQIASTDTRDLSSCEVCGASIDPDPPDGFTAYVRRVVIPRIDVRERGSDE
jgi:hypothetical protein